MTIYTGPATLITSTGAELPAEVELRVETDGRLKQWLGTATADGLDFTAVGAAHLRLPNGRTGEIFIGTITTGSDEVDFQGSGRPPVDAS